MLIIVETNNTAISVSIRSSIFNYFQEFNYLGFVIKFGYPSLK